MPSAFDGAYFQEKLDMYEWFNGKNPPKPAKFNASARTGTPKLPCFTPSYCQRCDYRPDEPFGDTCPQCACSYKSWVEWPVFQRRSERKGSVDVGFEAWDAQACRDGPDDIAYRCVCGAVNKEDNVSSHSTMLCWR